MSDEAEAEERRLRYLRARELLEGLGWLFDAFMAVEMRSIMQSLPTEGRQREEAYRRAKVAGELKAVLVDRVEEYENEQAVLKHREARDGRRTGDQQQQH